MSELIRTLLDALDIQRVVTDETAYPLAVFRSNEQLHPLEKYLPAPTAVRRAVMHSAFPSFLAYLDEWKNPGSRVYIENGRISAVIDHATTVATSWETHTSIFPLEPTPAAKMWRNHVTTDGSKAIDQMALALLFERRSQDVVSPDAATMLEMALTLEANPKVSWKSATRLQDGSRQFLFEEQVEARAGTKGQIVIPEKFTIGIPLWEGAASTSLEIKLRYRLEKGTIHFILEWVDLEDAEKASREALQAIIADKHQVPVFQGSYINRNA